MKLSAFCLLLFIGAFVHAQTLDLENARLLGLAASRPLAKHELSIRNSVLNEKNQLYSMLPSVSAGYSASMNFLRDWEFVNPADTLTAGATLSITQIIFQGGKGFIQKAISAIETENARIDALAEYFNVLDSIDNAYYAVLEASASLEAEESSFQAAVLSLSIAEIRQASGMINQGDYLRALADKESRENSYNQSRRNLALVTAKFKNLIGVTGQIELEHVDFSSYEDVLARLSAISDEEADALYNEFWKLLEASSPFLAKAALNNQREEHRYTLSKRNYVPVISATIFSSAFNYSTGRGFEPANPPSGVSITGKIPIDFWVMNNSLERSRIARDSAALDYTNAGISLETDLQSALLSAYSQAGSVLSTRRSLEYTQKNFEYVTERYRLSQSSVADMTDATSLFINSRNSHIRASYGFLQSLSRLRSLGAIDEEEKLLNLLMGN